MRAVTATGIVSVAHQIAINDTTAATIQPSELNPLGAGSINIDMNTSNPIPKPFFLYAFIVTRLIYYL
jgi:hypothetical protein